MPDILFYMKGLNIMLNVICRNRWVIICVIDAVSVSLKYILMGLFTHVLVILSLGTLISNNRWMAVAHQSISFTLSPSLGRGEKI